MKFGIIVDNPKRDLNGCTLLAYQLAKLGHTSFLIPMYTQGYDIPLLGLDGLIVNYARQSNREVLKAYKEMGIHVIVNDTEGGVLSESGLDSPDNWASLMKTSGLNEMFEDYTFWGEAVYRAFDKQEVLAHDHLHVTGSPRYDFCSPKWRDFLQAKCPPVLPKSEYILINSNFSAINPVFTRSHADEVRIFKSIGWDESYIDTFFADLKSVFAKFLKTIDELASSFPETSFVLRPHPFESARFYEDRLSQHPNVSVNPHGDVLYAISRAQCILHLNCGTAVESNLLGKLPICLDFLNTPIQIQHTPLPRKLSYCPQSLEELKTVLSSQTYTVESYDFEKVRREYIEPWFYINDGKAAERIAQLAVDTVKPAKQPKSIAWALKGSHSHPSLSQIGQGLMATVGGSQLATKVRSMITPVRTAKFFSAGQINDILEGISHLDSNNKVMATAARSPLGAKLTSLKVST